MYYNVDRTLSYNKLLNFVVGQRGVGKTYGAKNRAIKNFIKKGSQFVYLRRYDTELVPAKMELFFNDIQQEYPDHAFAVKFGKFYIDGKVAGFYMPLSKAAQFKSTPYPDVDLIIFDEFIIAEGLIRYLPDEVITFNEMYSTIARLRDVKVLFLSNAISFTNPYFIFFDLNLQKDQKILVKGDILLEVIDNPEYEEAAAQTRFGKIIANTDYGNYAIKNQFLQDNNTFVEKMPGSGNYLFTIRAKELSFGVYGVVENQNWYITQRVDNSCKRVISLDVKSHDTTSSLVKEESVSIWFDTLKQKFYRGEVRFSNVKSKNIIIPFLRRT